MQPPPNPERMFGMGINALWPSRLCVVEADHEPENALRDLRCATALSIASGTQLFKGFLYNHWVAPREIRDYRVPLYARLGLILVREERNCGADAVRFRTSKDFFTTTVAIHSSQAAVKATPFRSARFTRSDILGYTGEGFPYNPVAS